MHISVEKYFKLLEEPSLVMFVSLPGYGHPLAADQNKTYFSEHRAQRNDLNLPDLTVEMVPSRYPGGTWTYRSLRRNMSRAS